jgi:two-component system, cell cycle sensor histidine kinase and response regulator CckA
MLAIGDTGTGMDAATRERAFEPFFTTKPKGKGTGLGLATVYGIIDQSEGAIYLDTAPGHGTTVRIYLPATDTLPETGKVETAPRSPDRGTETLLLVEDNEAVRSLAARALQRRGYKVFEARSGEEALKLTETAGVRPDLLITDVIMPGLSGPSLAGLLLHRQPRLRVLYVSGYTDDANADRGAFLGQAPLLQKPFTPSTLAERIRAILDAPE